MFYNINIVILKWLVHIAIENNQLSCQETVFYDQ